MALNIVTGAFGYSGRYITQRLLDRGITVRTLTNSPRRANPFGDHVQAEPYHFDDAEKLAAALAGAEVLYNTYWVRFNHPTFTHADAVANTLTLFEAAKQAGVQRIVHVSITNPSEDSALEYFRGKARLERALIASGLSYSILRPGVIFGGEDILVNNIAWALRNLPVFGIFGDGSYRLQPIHVEDLAELAVTAGMAHEDQVIDAVGPETFTFRGLVETIAKTIGVRRMLVSVSPEIGYQTAQMIGKRMNDVFLTRDEIAGLMQGLLYTGAPPAGSRKLTEWARAHAASLGMRYASELARRQDREKSYAQL